MATIVIEHRDNKHQMAVDTDLWENFYVATGRSKKWKIIEGAISMEHPNKVEIIEKPNIIESGAEKPKRTYKKGSK